MNAIMTAMSKGLSHHPVRAGDFPALSTRIIGISNQRWLAGLVVMAQMRVVPNNAPGLSVPRILQGGEQRQT